MHCNVCDKMLSEKEIIWNEELGTYEPCTTCLDIALDAAYSGQFKADEDDDKFVLLDDEADDISWSRYHPYFRGLDDEDYS